MNKLFRKILYPAVFILGLFLMAWQIEIYRNTIISLAILFGIILTAGIIAFIIDFKKYKKAHDYNKFLLYFSSTLYYIVGYGFIACSLFMFTNYYFADGNIEKGTFKIINRSSMPGKEHHRDEREPLFRINYYGTTKEVVFGHDHFERMEFYSDVELEVSKGLFGFEIIRNKKLK